MSSEPKPKTKVEKVMKLIWEGEDPNNTWRSLIWNEYPLSDAEAEQILARLRATALKVIAKLEG